MVARSMTTIFKRGLLTKLSGTHNSKAFDVCYEALNPYVSVANVRAGCVLRRLFVVFVLFAAR